MIYDSRPWINAEANKLKGGGYEDCGDGGNYKNCKIQFCDIENIHEVKKSFNKMCALAYQNSFSADRNVVEQWLLALDQTGYRQVLYAILAATNMVLKSLQTENVLVHCSDGWDRTSQMCALAEMMIDPFYRTVKGFQILIEKDWLSFGHMFGRRCGHNSKTDLDNRSPVFIQFLDCVHQLWHLMPSEFEFNSDMLLFIADQVHTCKYGTFFFNSEAERKKENLRGCTIIIWMEIDLSFKKSF